MFLFSVALLILVASSNFLLGFFSVVHSERNDKSLYFGLTTFFVSIWAVALAAYSLLSDQNTILFLSKIAYFGAFLSSVSVLIFVVHFCYEPLRLKIKKTLNASFIALFILCFYFILNTELVIKGFKFFEIIDGGINNGVLNFGPLYYIYALFIVLFFSTSFILLILFLKKSKLTKKKRQAKNILAGIFVAIIGGLVTNLLLPSMGVFTYYWLGPVFTFVMVTFLSVAIIKYKLFNIKVVTTEILIFALWVILAFKTVTADSPQDFFISGFILMATIFIGIFLIRSVTKEVHQREEIEKLAARVEKANERLRKVDKIKTEFMSIVSHQLRTPLSIVKGHLSMIQEGLYDKEPEKKEKIINDLYENNERLIALVNDVLNTSRIQSGKVEVKKEKADIVKIAEGIVSKLSPPAKEKGIELLIHHPEEEIPLLNIDTSKIENALLNLVDNAIKYTNEGSVELSLEKKQKSVVIKIKDSGDGMDQEELEKLFETFSRGGAGKKYWVQGAGLGLYIARRFVEMHGGKTWAESEGKGKGSSFYIKLPI
jgi:signal transduction histidine kinase